MLLCFVSWIIDPTLQGFHLERVAWGQVVGGGGGGQGNLLACTHLSECMLYFS